MAGSFLSAWQAGTHDGGMRVLAVRTGYDADSLTRSVEGAFGFGADAAARDGSILGMVCNYTGPGRDPDHVPLPFFQWQQAGLGATDAHFVIPVGGSRITYAPTNSCSSATTAFDVDRDGVAGSGEGVGTVGSLDAPTGGNDVEQELQARGLTLPGWF